MSEAGGYFLRIATEEWVEQVFNIAVYYTSLHKKWEKGQTILFLHKTDVGDSVVGYGVIGGIHEREELSEEERSQCSMYGWKKAIEFSYVIRFRKPLPIRETSFRNSKLRGRCFHGFKLSTEQARTIVTQAERLQR
jgi:hypothetical protein